jgi:hypothetical protein
MISRCVLDSCGRWYKFKGVKVCKRWMKFENFLADMGERPVGKGIDRIKNHKGYQPGNCRWATPKEQARNRSTNRILIIDGVSKTLIEWSEVSGIGKETISQRIKRGYSERRAVFSPLDKRGSIK